MTPNTVKAKIFMLQESTKLFRNISSSTHMHIGQGTTKCQDDIPRFCKEYSSSDKLCTQLMETMKHVKLSRRMPRHLRSPQENDDLIVEYM